MAAEPNELSQQDLDLLAAAGRGDVPRVDELLNAGAKINAIDHNNNQGTILHIAVARGDNQLIAYLNNREQKPDINLTDGQFNTPIDLARNAGRGLLCLQLAQARTPFRIEKLISMIRHCSKRFSEASTPHEKHAVICHYVSRLIGQNIGDLYATRAGRRSVRLTYLAHLEEMNATHRNQNLLGWHHKDFLPLRIHAFFELIIRLQTDSIAEIDLPNLNVAADVTKNDLKRRLIVDLISEIETNMEIKEFEAIRHEREWFRPYARILTTRVAALHRGHSYTYGRGFEGHTLYVTPKRCPGNDDFTIRLDNLGFGCRRHRNGPRGNDYYIPYFVRVSHEHFTVPDGPAVDYFEGLLIADTIKVVNRAGELNNDHAAEALRLIYTNLETLLQAEQLDWDGPDFEMQREGDCVVHNHQIGLRMRLGTSIAFRWVLNMEKQLVASQARIEAAHPADWATSTVTGWQVTEHTQAQLNNDFLQAAQDGDWALLNRLRDKGASLRAVDQDGRNALHLAAFAGRTDVVANFIEPQVPLIDLSLRCNAGYSVAHWAVAGGHQDVLNLLEYLPLIDMMARDNRGNGLLQIAAIHNHSELLRYMVEVMELGVQSVNGLGRNCLMLAALHGCEESVTYLLSLDRINVHALDTCGNTAQRLAEMAGHNNIKTLLTAATKTSVPATETAFGASKIRRKLSRYIVGLGLKNTSTAFGNDGELIVGFNLNQPSRAHGCLINVLGSVFPNLQREGNQFVVPASDLTSTNYQQFKHKHTQDNMTNPGEVGMFSDAQTTTTTTQSRVGTQPNI